MPHLIYKPAVWFLLGRKLGNKDYQDYRQLFEASSEKILGIIHNATQDDKGHRQLTHLIGMERWMCSRIRVALGEPFVDEEYDVYRPPKEANWAYLEQAFMETRKESCELCDALTENKVDDSGQIEHNQFGMLSVKTWLEYLLYHGDSHAGRIPQKGR